MEKKLFDGDKFTEDKDCSLNPPVFYTGKQANSGFFSSDKRAWQSAPTVVVTKKGRMFCTFSGDNSGTGDECPNNYNVLIYSDDKGETWTDNVLVIDHNDSVRIHGPILYVDKTNTLWLFWAQSYIYWDSRGGTWVSKCKDPDADTLVWSEPKRLCHGVMAGVPIENSKGEYMLPVSIWKNVTRHAFNHLPELEYSCVYTSTDGENFTLRGYADEPDTTFDENYIVERSDGSYMMIMRCTKSISVSYSYDDAKTWTTPKKLMDHTSSRSFMSKFSNGNILLVTNDPENVPAEHLGTEHGRIQMTAFLSTDGGETFSHKLLLYKEGMVSYPSGMIDDNDRVYVSFDRNRYTDGEIYMSSFTQEDIIAGKCETEGSYAAKLIMRSDKVQGKHKVFEDGSTYTDK